MLDKVLYQMNVTTGKIQYVNSSIPEKSFWEKFLERGKVPENNYNDPKGIFKDFENWLKDGHDNAVANAADKAVDKVVESIPWMKIGHFFADISVIVSLALLIWYCYGVMIGSKDKREHYSQRIYVSMMAVFITRCVEVLMRER